jgi:NTP pyrophosphatase (non-canonical NTP hydrolase)
MDIQELTDAMHAFVRAKGWYEPNSPRPQTPRNLAASLAIEAAEVLEHYQWAERAATPELAGELADVALYLLQLASVTGVDLEQAILEKLRVNYGRQWDQADAPPDESA